MPVPRGYLSQKKGRIVKMFSESNEEYCGFIGMEDDESFEEKEFKHSGQWKGDLGDLLPNVFQCHVELYSRRESTHSNEFVKMWRQKCVHADLYAACAWFSEVF